LVTADALLADLGFDDAGVPREGAVQMALSLNGCFG
jgi:hypothetical protein